ncbi:hypothetical protein LCGC14_2346320, partial [marine sediment metagenome]
PEEGRRCSCFLVGYVRTRGGCGPFRSDELKQLPVTFQQLRHNPIDGSKVIHRTVRVVVVWIVSILVVHRIKAAQTDAAVHSPSPSVGAARGVNTQTNRPRINRASELATHPINAPNQNPSAIGLSLEAVQEITVQHVPDGLCKRQRREIEPRSPSNSVDAANAPRVPDGRPPVSVRVSNVF